MDLVFSEIRSNLQISIVLADHILFRLYERNVASLAQTDTISNSDFER